MMLLLQTQLLYCHIYIANEIIRSIMARTCDSDVIPIHYENDENNYQTTSNKGIAASVAIADKLFFH